MARPVSLFFSYSHKDEDLRGELETHLSPLRRQQVISGWHDRMITPGDEWKSRIDENLNQADVILLLVTPNFLASDYCFDVEMKQAMGRHELGEACVIPVIVRPVDWHGEPFAKLHCLPRDGKPITRWPDRDEAWLDVVKGIRKAAEAFAGRPPARRASATGPAAGSPPAGATGGTVIGGDVANSVVVTGNGNTVNYSGAPRQAPAPAPPGGAPTTPSLRKLINQVLITDADLEAFCVNHYADVRSRFSGGMDRLSKVNLLLTYCPTGADRARLLQLLRDDDDYGERARAVAGATIRYE